MAQGVVVWFRRAALLLHRCPQALQYSAFTIIAPKTIWLTMTRTAVELGHLPAEMSAS